MNTIDIFKAENITDIRLTLDGIAFALDGVEHTINYEAISPIEACILRLLYAQQIKVTGQSTAEMLKILESNANNESIANL